MRLSFPSFTFFHFRKRIERKVTNTSLNKVEKHFYIIVCLKNNNKTHLNHPIGSNYLARHHTVACMHATVPGVHVLLHHGIPTCHQSLYVSDCGSRSKGLSPTEARDVVESCRKVRQERGRRCQALSNYIATCKRQFGVKPPSQL